MERKISFEILNKHVKDENYIMHLENVEGWNFVKWYPNLHLKGIKVFSVLKQFKETGYSRSASRPYTFAI